MSFASPESILKVLQSIAIVAGASWFVIEIVVGRWLEDAAIIELEASELFSGSDFSILDVELQIENVGANVVRVKEIELEVRSILDETGMVGLDALKRAFEDGTTNDPVRSWPEICSAKVLGAIEVEPKERHIETLYVVLPADVRMVQVVVEVQEVRRVFERENFGWSVVDQARLRTQTIDQQSPFPFEVSGSERPVGSESNTSSSDSKNEQSDFTGEVVPSSNQSFDGCILVSA